MKRLAVDKAIPVTIDRIATNLSRMPTALLWSASSDRATTLYVKGRPSVEADPESYRFSFKLRPRRGKVFSYKGKLPMVKRPEPILGCSPLKHFSNLHMSNRAWNTAAQLASRHRHAREDRRPCLSRLVSRGQSPVARRTREVLLTTYS